MIKKRLKKGRMVGGKKGHVKQLEMFLPHPLAPVRTGTILTTQPTLRVVLFWGISDVSDTEEVIKSQ